MGEMSRERLETGWTSVGDRTGAFQPAAATAEAAGGVSLGEWCHPVGAHGQLYVQR